MCEERFSREGVLRAHLVGAHLVIPVGDSWSSPGRRVEGLGPGSPDQVITALEEVAGGRAGDITTAMPAPATSTETLDGGSAAGMITLPESPTPASAVVTSSTADQGESALAPGDEHSATR
jgi:hypothetical protein